MSSSSSLIIFILFILSLSFSSIHANIISPLPSIQIRNACRATRNISLCSSALSQSPPPPDPTPNDLVLALLALVSVKNDAAKIISEALLESSLKLGDVNRTNAAENCIQGLTYSNRRVAAATRAMRPGGGADIADIRAWASAALLYQAGCLSGMRNVRSTDAQMVEAMSQTSYLTNITSSALSMVAAIQRYGNDTSKWGPPSTERDGYWGTCGAHGKECSELGSTAGVPLNLTPNATVCKAGCGYITVKAAVDAYPSNGLGLYVIYIKEGVYEETVRVDYDKTNVVFVGDGMGKTIITGSLNAGMVGVTTYHTATVGVIGDGFMARNLTIRNTAGPEAHQAVAFRSDSDRSILESVEFVGHQDTLYTHSLRQFYKYCTIYGTVDFIFGDAAAFFQDSHVIVIPRQLKPNKGGVNTITAQGRIDPAQSTGFVFYNCVVDGNAEYMKYYNMKPALHQNYLGRPWREYSRTVFIDCYLGEIISPEGWSRWVGDFALTTLFYGEFRSKGPGRNVTERVHWSNQIPKKHVHVYSVENFIQLGRKEEFSSVKH